MKKAKVKEEQAQVSGLLSGLSGSDQPPAESRQSVVTIVGSRATGKTLTSGICDPPNQDLGWKLWSETEPWFLQTFGKPMRFFADVRIWAAGGGWVFDIVHFDRFLHREFHYHETNDGSMSDFLKKRFGDEAEAKIRALLQPST